MLTKKQRDLLLFIHQKIKEDGISPSFDEMKEALDLRSKSGIHRLITSLEERGFLRRLANRARAIEIIRLPETGSPGRSGINIHAKGFSPAVIEGDLGQAPAWRNHDSDMNTATIPVMGRIAAGTPIEAIQNHSYTLNAPVELLGKGEHYALEVRGDSMIDAGILDGDMVLIQKNATPNSGDIVVALIDNEEATLKRFRKKGTAIALEAANPAYETRIFGPGHVTIQGKMVGLMRSYN